MSASVSCFIINSTCFRLRAARLISAKFPHRSVIFIIWINIRISGKQTQLMRIYIAMTSRWLSKPGPSSSPCSLVVINKFSLWSGCGKQAVRTIIRTQIRSEDYESKKKIAILTETVVPNNDLTTRAFRSSWFATTNSRSIPRSFLRLKSICFAWQSIATAWRATTIERMLPHPAQFKVSTPAPFLSPPDVSNCCPHGVCSHGLCCSKLFTE